MSKSQALDGSGSGAPAAVLGVGHAPGLMSAQIGGAVDPATAVSPRAMARDRDKTAAHRVADSRAAQRGDDVVADACDPSGRIETHSAHEACVALKPRTDTSDVGGHAATYPGDRLGARA